MKKIKMWIELLFIFLLPLIFMSLSVKIETTKEYDENNNEISKISNFKWEYQYNDYKSNEHYINYLKLNQLVHEPSSNNYYLDIEGNYNIYYNFSSTYDYVDYHKYYIYIKYNYDESSLGSFYFYSNGTSISRVNVTTTYPIYQNIVSCSVVDNVYRFVLYGTSQNYYKGSIEYQLIDLTEMFGSGYEPSTISELSNYLDLNNLINYTDSELLLYYSQNINISENWKYNYSVWGTIYNDIIIKNLYLTDTITTRFILTYTITWFIMFIIWHTLYIPFDWLIHLVTPKQKE